MGSVYQFTITAVFLCHITWMSCHSLSLVTETRCNLTAWIPKRSAGNHVSDKLFNFETLRANAESEVPSDLLLWQTPKSHKQKTCWFGLSPARLAVVFLNNTTAISLWLTCLTPCVLHLTSADVAEVAVSWRGAFCAVVVSDSDAMTWVYFSRRSLFWLSGN